MVRENSHPEGVCVCEGEGEGVWENESESKNQIEKKGESVMRGCDR